MLNPSYWWQPHWYLTWKHISILLQNVRNNRRQRMLHVVNRNQSILAYQSIGNRSGSNQFINIRFSSKQAMSFQSDLIFLTTNRFYIFFALGFSFLSFSNIITYNSFRRHRKQNNFLIMVYERILI